MVRAPCSEKLGLKKGPWTTEEDLILTNYVTKHGHKNWSVVPTQAGLLRCGKSCRLRWINYLRPDIKRGNLTKEEEDMIIQMHQMLGNRWAMIAARLPGRTDNEIKNVWHTRLKKRLPHHQNADTHNTKRQRKQLNHDVNSACSEVSTLTITSAVNQVSINNVVESLDDDFWSDVLSSGITNSSSSDWDFNFSSSVYDNVNFWYDGYIRAHELPGF